MRPLDSMAAVGSSEAGKGENEELFFQLCQPMLQLPGPETDNGTTVYPTGTQNRNLNAFSHFTQPAHSVLPEFLNESMSSLAVRGW